MGAEEMMNRKDRKEEMKVEEEEDATEKLSRKISENRRKYG